MNIYYIHQYFKLPSEAGGTRSYWLAKALIDKGYNVTVITTSNNIQKSKEFHFVDNINIVYFRISYNQKFSIFKRLISFLLFTIRSIIFLFYQKNVDLIFATSTPLSVGIAPLLFHKLRKIPFIFEVRDLWPEVPIQMGAIKNRLLIKLIKNFEISLYKNSKKVIALSPGMADGILKYVTSDKVVIIPNISKLEIFWPRAINYCLVDDLGLSQNSFKVIHFGSLGLANGAEYILDAAKYFNDNIEIIFIGGGSQEEFLKKKVSNLGLRSVKFLGSFDLATTSEIVNFCHISIVSFLNLPILFTNSPNKFFDSLAAGKPIIVNSNGWTREIVEKYNCGYYVNPCNPKDLSTLVNFLSKEPSLVQKLGDNSRSVAKEKFDLNLLSIEFTNIFDKILK